MKALKGGVLVALVLVSAIGLVASPVFATPRLTSSTGTFPNSGSVSPFITPIGNTTTSSIRVMQNLGFRNGLSISGVNHLGARFQITCFEFNALGYIDRTHTQLKLTSLTTRCQDDLAAFAVNVTFRTLNSATPYLIHFRRDPIGGGVSWDSTFNIPAGSLVELFEPTLRCTVHIRPQSIDTRYTNTNRAIEFLDTSVHFTSADATPGCFDPARGAMSWSTIPGRPIRLVPQTANDVLMVTTAS